MTLDDDDGCTCFMLFHFFLCDWDNKCGVRFCSLENLQPRFTMKSAVLDELYCPVRPLVQRTILKLSFFPVRSTSLGRAGGEFLEKQDLLPHQLLSQNGDEGPTSEGGEENG